MGGVAAGMVSPSVTPRKLRQGWTGLFWISTIGINLQLPGNPTCVVFDHISSLCISGVCLPVRWPLPVPGPSFFHDVASNLWSRTFSLPVEIINKGHFNSTTLFVLHFGSHHTYFIIMVVARTDSILVLLQLEKKTPGRIKARLLNTSHCEDTVSLFSDVRPRGITPVNFP